MTNEDYIDILNTLRIRLRDSGLGDLEERISSNLRGHEGPFWELTYFLKSFMEVIRTGTSEQYQELLDRTNRYVKTESGEPVSGLRIQFTEEDAVRYKQGYIDYVPNEELDELSKEVSQLIHDLHIDYEKNFGRDIEGPDFDL